MKRAILTAAALAAGLGCATAGTANASPATDAFNAACTANPGFFSFAVTGLEEDREGLSRLCSCLATEFSGLRDADLAMLTKDVDGTANAADRTAYGDLFAPQVSTADADVLAHDLDGTATDASRKAHAGYDTIAGIAGTAFGGCFATLLRH